MAHRQEDYAWYDHLSKPNLLWLRCAIISVLPTTYSFPIRAIRPIHLADCAPMRGNHGQYHPRL